MKETLRNSTQMVMNMSTWVCLQRHYGALVILVQSLLNRVVTIMHTEKSIPKAHTVGQIINGVTDLTINLPNTTPYQVMAIPDLLIIKRYWSFQTIQKIVPIYISTKALYTCALLQDIVDIHYELYAKNNRFSFSELIFFQERTPDYSIWSGVFFICPVLGTLDPRF